MGKNKLDKQGRPKKPFYQTWLPWKGDRPSQVILKLLTLVMLVVFLGAAGYLINELVILPMQADQVVSEIQDVFYETEEPSSSESSESADPSASPEATQEPEEEQPEMTDEEAQAQIRKLQETYPDIVGWLRIPNTVIDYPVLQSSESDPEYYLYRNYKGETTKYGSIFMQAGTALDGSDQNLLLYGHSMRDGRMFAQVGIFNQIDVYKNSPVITFNTANGGGKWKIFAVFKTNTDESQGEPFYYTYDHFDSDSEYLNFVYQIRQRSIIDTGVDFNENDTMLSLSTCSYEFDGWRTVVVARLVRDGEDPTVDTSQASYNPDVVYPQCWYDRYGGSVPQWPDTFEEALEQGRIDWYTPPADGE